MRGRRTRWILILVATAIIIVGGIGLYVASWVGRDEPTRYSDILDHYKYGSYGSDKADSRGIPYELWLVLPTVFENLLPDHPGRGYERLGFIYEPGHERPIGTSYRENPIGLVGLNCAVCHTSTVREAPDARQRIVLTMPANQFRLASYVNFLRAVGRDSRFEAETLISAIKERNPDFSMRDELLYRHFIIPRTRAVLRRLDDDFAWQDRRPPQGPGRVDTFNPYKVIHNIDNSEDDFVGTVDLPSIWNQRPRQGLYLHWDGNNNSVDDRNISAAIGSGATEDTLELQQVQRVKEWLLDLPAPQYPADRIDRTLAAQGERIYRDSCAQCHAFTDSRVGQVTPIDEIGTDRERLDSFTPELAKAQNTIGEGKPWKLNHFRKTNGYANQPLDGIWLRAPYLHNGSVPDLASLLMTPEDRPKVFYRGYDVYDWERVGFVTRGDEARRVGWRFDTDVRGNGNGGHAYGVDLPQRAKEALLEYLKTL